MKITNHVSSTPREKPVKNRGVRVSRMFCWFPTYAIDTQEMHWMQSMWCINISLENQTLRVFSTERFPASYITQTPEKTFNDLRKSCRQKSSNVMVSINWWNAVLSNVLTVLLMISVFGTLGLLFTCPEYANPAWQIVATVVGSAVLSFWGLMRHGNNAELL